MPQIQEGVLGLTNSPNEDRSPYFGFSPNAIEGNGFTVGILIHYLPSEQVSYNILNAQSTDRHMTYLCDDKSIN
jgi:hypothetical protein